MNRQEFKDAIEKCCEEIAKNKNYGSYDAVNEIMMLYDETLVGPRKTIQVKSGEMFECEGRKYIIKTLELASQKGNLDNGQNIFTLEEIN